MTIVEPIASTKKYTYIRIKIEICGVSQKSSKCSHNAIRSKKDYFILEIAKSLADKFKFLPVRQSEGYPLDIILINFFNKIINKIGKSSLENYIAEFKRPTYNSNE